MEGDLKLASLQSLECPLCLSTFNDPKILSCCGHSFCKVCLDQLVKSYGEKILCPVCRVETTVPERDVSHLLNNQAVKSLVQDVKSQSQVCMDCEVEEKPKAVAYCQDCGKYLCVTCQGKHSQGDKWGDHEVLDVKEIASGKVAVRKYRKCRVHPRENEECFCSDCRKFACFRCALKEHVHEKHEVMEALTYASVHRVRVDELTSKAKDKHARIRKYMDYIDEQRGSIENVKKQCISDISKAYEESVAKLREQKESLLQEVVRKNSEADATLGRLKETAQQQMAQVATMTDLVDNNKKVPLETEALAAHDSLVKGLQEALKKEYPNYKEPSTSSKVGHCISFERHKQQDEVGLGKIVHSMKKRVELPAKTMSNMAATLDGLMALGCRKGGIEIISADGKLQKTVLKDIGIRYVDFLSDGRYVVLDDSNTITLYTKECERLDVKFKTLSNEEALYGSLAVDSNDLIYVNYRNASFIQVFSEAGGKPTSLIPLRKGQAKLIACRDIFIISEHSSIRAIDKAGAFKTEAISRRGCCLCCAATLRETLLVAWVTNNCSWLTIDEFTYEFKHVKRLISEFKIENPKNHNAHSIYLQEFRSGEIAFATLDTLYIFR